MKHIKILLFVAALCATMLSQAAEKEILNETFALGQGAFTIENVDLGSLTSIWRANTSYGYMSASAYNSGSANASEAWLISPAFDLANCTTATLTFDHAAKFQNGTVREEFQVYYAVSPSATFDASEWTNVTIPDYPTAGDWTYVSSGGISLPITATKIAFRYKSTAAAADTWQVKNVKIVGQNDEAEPALPIALPNIGEPTLVVCAQNLRNYFINYSSASKSDCSDLECLKTKTSKIVDVFRFVDADIFAMCELEANDTTLKVITDSLNGRTSDRPYAYVADGISDDGYSFIKSGFIYRTDKVKTVGSNNASTSQTYYKYTMRYQMFEELATGERFTLSMNHFKAKDNTDDQGNAKRVSEATDLINKMKAITADPDILIVGDLNCEMGEEPLKLLVDAGYEEQLLRYDSAATSHCYNGAQLIDHAFANSAMAAQITGASVYHICTSCSSGAAYNSDYRYSDHDPYLIGLKLTSDGSGDGGDDECKEINFSETFYSSLGGFSSVNVSGTNDWYVDTNYHYAKMNGAASDNNEDWLISPAFDLSKHQVATLSFDHAANKGNAANKTTMQTLWMSADYVDGDPSTGTWTQVTIPTYPEGNSWTFVNSGNITVPTDFLVKDMHFAFKYVAATASEGSCWEIKNVVLNASCSATAIEQPTATNEPIFAANGRIYGADDMRIYTVLGLDVTRQNGSLCGVYIVKVGDKAQKVVVSRK